MQTVKTGIVVALLLAVCYGAFVALNAPDPELPAELAEWAAEEANLDSLMDIEMPAANAIGEASEGQPGSLSGVTFPATELSAIPKINIELPVATQNPEVGKAPIPAGQGQEGPAIALPTGSTRETANVASGLDSNSLILDTTGKNSIPGSAPNLATVAKSSIPEFPSIPLPGMSQGADGSSKSADTPIQLAGNQTKADVSPLPLLSEAGSQSSVTATRPVSSSAPTLEPFQVARGKALEQAAEGKLKEALQSLTRYYNSPEVTHSEYTDLLDILDALAREVIFSQRHLIKPAYTASAGETIASVAAQHRMTTELLSNINRLGNAQVLTQGQQVKVIDGPFRGEVDLTRGEITLYVQEMYASRFPISVGEDPAPRIGSFEVADKRRDRTYYGSGGKVINADDPQNPYGGFWMDLGHGMCLHGSPEMIATDMRSAGCISLSPIDAADVYIMLAQGSQIEIRK